MTNRLTATLARLWLLCLPLVQGALANDSERFLESLSSETREGQLVISVYFTRRLEYLSHSPAGAGDHLEIRLRAPGPLGQTPDQLPGTGLRSLAPSQILQLQSIRTTGNLDSDPGLSLRFDRARRYRVRAGRNERSIDILLESVPAAEVAAEPTAGLPPVPDAGTPAEQALADLFRQARLAFTAGQYQRTTAIYDKIIATGIEPYVREARVALGVTRAERKQSAQARAQFERYLQDYPDGPEARRVKRLLEALLEQTDGKAEAADGPDEASAWQLFGSLDQSYLLDHGKLDGRDSETFRSSLLSSANLNWQGRVGEIDVSGRFSGSYDYSFLSQRDSPGRVSYLYVDLEDRDGSHEGRLGRQRLPGSGVLGYFDGLHYQYHLNDRRSLHYVVGSPMRATRDGIDEDRLFHGLAVDFNNPDDRWYLSLYGLYQRFDGETDRRALGAEGRYLGDRVTAYSLLDYDTHFDELNIFYLFGNWRIREGTVAGLTLDYRRSPGLALSNAVYSLGADDFDDLATDYSDEELERLAKDRSLVYRSLYGSLTQRLDARWQLLLDGGIYSLRSDSDAPGSGDLESDDWYLHGQLMGNGLFKAADMYSAGLRYTDAERMDVTSVLLRARIPVAERWRLSPRLRLDFRDRDDGDDQRRLLPSLFATYRLSRNTSLEFDIGAEFARTDRDEGDDLDDRFLFLRAGYRHDF